MRAALRELPNQMCFIYPFYCKSANIATERMKNAQPEI